VKFPTWRKKSSASAVASLAGLSAALHRDSTLPEASGLERPLFTNNDETLCVFNLDREAFLGLSVTRADTLFSRLRGLLGRRKLRSDEGLWTVPSQGIHTICLHFPIDLIYLDETNQVVHLIENLGSFRIAPIRLDCASVLQLPTRAIHSSNTQIGDKLLICSPEEIAQQCGRKEFARQ
jgi:uncharacterized membrane protein (UPF0127 family)